MPLSSLPTFPNLQLPLFGSNPGNSHGLSLMDIMMENQNAAVASGNHFSGNSNFGDVGHNVYSNASFHGGNFVGQEKMLSLEWQQDQGFVDGSRDGLGYPSGLSFWASIMNGHGSAASNSFV